MPTVYLSLGSNVGDRRANLDAAVQRLRAEPGLRLLNVSSIYEATPHGAEYAGQPKFLNSCAAISTKLAPVSLLRLLLNIEHDLGRVRTAPHSPRTCDLDILFYDDLVLDEESLTIPHPRMHERGFVLVPLAEIADDFLHPTLRKTVAELRAEIEATGVELAFEKQPLRRRDLLGLRVLVTGSTSGIGRAIAQSFADNGASVVLHGRDGEKAEETRVHLERYGMGVETSLCDFADPVAFAKFLEHWSKEPLDVLVCNAGADTLTGLAAKWTFEEKLQVLLNVDLVGTMRLARAVGTKMKQRGRGCLLTIGWDQAETGMEGDSGELFAAVKGGITCFTRSLSLSLAPEVRVNCIAPGWIRTAWGDNASELWHDRVRKETPLKVWGVPDDIANAAVWLANPASKFITGQTIRVNGGVVRF